MQTIIFKVKIIVEIVCTHHKRMKLIHFFSSFHSVVATLSFWKDKCYSEWQVVFLLHLSVTCPCSLWEMHSTKEKKKNIRKCNGHCLSQTHIPKWNLVIISIHVTDSCVKEQMRFFFVLLRGDNDKQHFFFSRI